MLVGGLGGGGKGYFALNVTDPDSIVLERSECSQLDALGIHGWRRHIPGRLIRHSPRRGRWRARRSERQPREGPRVCGHRADDRDEQRERHRHPRRRSGWRCSATDTTPPPVSRSCSCCSWTDGLDGWAAGDFVKLDTGVGVPASGPAARRVPECARHAGRWSTRDLNGTADLAYAGDLLGNMYRFDLSNSNPNNWTVTTHLYGHLLRWHHRRSPADHRAADGDQTPDPTRIHGDLRHGQLRHEGRRQERRRSSRSTGSGIAATSHRRPRQRTRSRCVWSNRP